MNVLNFIDGRNYQLQQGIQRQTNRLFPRNAPSPSICFELPHFSVTMSCVGITVTQTVCAQLGTLSMDLEQNQISNP